MAFPSHAFQVQTASLSCSYSISLPAGHLTLLSRLCQRHQCILESCIMCILLGIDSWILPGLSLPCSSMLILQHLQNELFFLAHHVESFPHLSIHLLPHSRYSCNLYHTFSSILVSWTPSHQSYEILNS